MHIPISLFLSCPIVNIYLRGLGEWSKGTKKKTKHAVSLMF